MCVYISRIPSNSLHDQKKTCASKTIGEAKAWPNHQFGRFVGGWGREGIERGEKALEAEKTENGLQEREGDRKQPQRTSPLCMGEGEFVEGGTEAWTRTAEKGEERERGGGSCVL